MSFDARASLIRIFGSRSHRGDSLDSVLSNLGSHELIAVGSSLKLCMLAEGSADLYSSRPELLNPHFLIYAIATGSATACSKAPPVDPKLARAARAVSPYP